MSIPVPRLPVLSRNAHIYELTAYCMSPLPAGISNPGHFFILSGGTRALSASFVNLAYDARSRCLFSKRGHHPRRPFDFHRFRDMLIPVLPPSFVPHVCHRLKFHQLPPVGKYFVSHRTSMFHWARIRLFRTPGFDRTVRLKKTSYPELNSHSCCLRLLFQYLLRVSQRLHGIHRKKTAASPL